MKKNTRLEERRKTIKPENAEIAKQQIQRTENDFFASMDMLMMLYGLHKKIIAGEPRPKLEFNEDDNRMLNYLYLRQLVIYFPSGMIMLTEKGKATAKLIEKTGLPITEIDFDKIFEITRKINY